MSLCLCGKGDYVIMYNEIICITHGEKSMYHISVNHMSITTLVIKFKIYIRVFKRPIVIIYDI